MDARNNASLMTRLSPGFLRDYSMLGREISHLLWTTKSFLLFKSVFSCLKSYRIGTQGPKGVPEKRSLAILASLEVSRLLEVLEWGLKEENHQKLTSEKMGS